MPTINLLPLVPNSLFNTCSLIMGKIPLNILLTMSLLMVSFFRRRHWKDTGGGSVSPAGPGAVPLESGMGRSNSGGALSQPHTQTTQSRSDLTAPAWPGDHLPWCSQTVDSRPPSCSGARFPLCTCTPDHLPPGHSSRVLQCVASCLFRN